MKAKFQKFMTYRYGGDNLGKFLSTGALILCFISLLTNIRLLWALSFVLLLLCTFRMFSKNTQKRYAENLLFMQKTQKIRKFIQTKKINFSQRKTHKFYHCPTCKQSLRVPRGKGEISINCPKCGATFKKHT